MRDTADIDDGLSCCAADEAPPSTRQTTGDSCGCSHAPQAPAELTKATVPAPPETTVAGALTAAMNGILSPIAGTPRATARSAPPGSVHAIFILDCAYLI